VVVAPVAMAERRRCWLELMASVHGNIGLPDSQSKLWRSNWSRTAFPA